LFRVAFEQRARYDTARPSCLPWLYGIAGNLLRHRRRSSARQAAALARAAAATADLAGGGELDDDIVARVDAISLSPQLAALLHGLTEGERELILLHTWEGLSYDQLAQATDLPVGTVRSRLHRGRRKLRERLGGNGDRPDGIDPPDPPTSVWRCAP
jgi:RNA polymerase sigma factor (sigma-70 family)